MRVKKSLEEPQLRDENPGAVVFIVERGNFKKIASLGSGETVTFAVDAIFLVFDEA